MPTVLRIGAFRFYLYSHEPVEVAKTRGFRAHEIGGIVGMVEAHREQLLEAWHGYFG